MKTKIKICGIQQLEDAKKAIAAGADYIGFIFAENSIRAVEQSVAKSIIEEVRDRVVIVGVFRNNTLDEVNSLCVKLKFDLVQLHGEESLEYCQSVICPVIKSFGLSSNFVVERTLQNMKKYNVKYYLIDREKPGKGEKLSLKNSEILAKNFSTFFAGGLTPENVSEAIEHVKPFAVDVISGVKTNDNFDFTKMKRFVANAKGVNL